MRYCPSFQPFIVAGGLHPEIKDRTFRVGHMGHATTRPEMLEATVTALGRALEGEAAIPLGLQYERS